MLSAEAEHRQEVLIIHDNMRKPNSIIILLYIFHIIEGLPAKRTYIEFWPIFIFLQDRADFWQTDLIVLT